MFRRIEQLVNENNLTFTGAHTTEKKRLLEDGNKEMFLREFRRSLDWIKVLEEKEITIEQDFCLECGKYVDYRLNGNELVPSTPDCYEEKEVAVNIPVPSGELLIDDWYEYASNVLGHLEDRYVNISATFGQVEKMKEYANAGVGHFACGVSPFVYQKQDGTVLIGKPSHDENGEEISLDEKATNLGKVTTELRWITVCDRSVYEQIAIKKLGEEAGEHYVQLAAQKADVVVRVEPGEYELRYFIDVKKDYKLFASLKKIK